MELKQIGFWGAVGVAALVAWEYRNSDFVNSLVRPASTPKPVAIEFDNGTVRQYDIASEPAPAPVRRRADGLLKCRRGDSVTYTNFECPPGTKPEALAGGTVSVMASEGLPKPTAATPKSGNAQQSLHDALDLSGNDNVREKRMERLIEKGSTR